MKMLWENCAEVSDEAVAYLRNDAELTARVASPECWALCRMNRCT